MGESIMWTLSVFLIDVDTWMWLGMHATPSALLAALVLALVAALCAVAITGHRAVLPHPGTTRASRETAPVLPRATVRAFAVGGRGARAPDARPRIPLRTAH